MRSEVDGINLGTAFLLVNVVLALGLCLPQDDDGDTEFVGNTAGQAPLCLSWVLNRFLVADPGLLVSLSFWCQEPARKPSSVHVREIKFRSDDKEMPWESARHVGYFRCVHWGHLSDFALLCFASWSLFAKWIWLPDVLRTPSTSSKKLLKPSAGEVIGPFKIAPMFDPQQVRACIRAARS